MNRIAWHLSTTAALAVVLLAGCSRKGPEKYKAFKGIDGGQVTEIRKQAETLGIKGVVTDAQVGPGQTVITVDPGGTLEIVDAGTEKERTVHKDGGDIPQTWVILQDGRKKRIN